MCGLVGVFSSNMMMKHRDCLNTLLYLDTFRGRDSTGVATIRHNFNTDILKATVPGYEFIEGPRLNHMLQLNDICWIGHNRFGTIGKNIKTNAHPFMIEDDEGGCLLVGAHNGTLKNKHVLDQHAEFGTDSEALYFNIAHNGIEDTIPRVEGAWALTYFDHITRELRVIRNKERTLFYAYEKGKKTMIWASEIWMIKVACARANIEIDGDNIFSFAEDTLYSFPAPERMNAEVYHTRKGGLVGKTVGFFQSNTPNNNWNRERWTGGGSGHTPQAQSQTTPQTQTTGTVQKAVTSVKLLPGVTTPYGTQNSNDGESLPEKNDASSSSAPSSQSSEEGKKILSIASGKTWKGFGGSPLSLSELKDELAGGCQWCEISFIAPTDRFAWLGPKAPVCAKCMDGTHKTGYEEHLNNDKKLVIIQ